MEFRNSMDLHSHSNHSPDSTASMHEMCATAAKIGVRTFAVTDHCECDLFVQDNYEERTKASYEEMTKLIKHYENQDICTKFLVGVELGQALENEDAARTVLKNQYDIVLGSLHRAKGMPDYCFIDYKSYGDSDLDRLLREYYLELFAYTKANYFDVLAHLTYPLRYIIGDAGRKIDIKKCDDIIEEIFKTMILHNIALEVNVSGFHQKIKESLPNKYYVEMYRKLGGRFITVGTDSHSIKGLGAGIDEGMKMISEVGFKELTYFEKRLPKPQKIY